MIYLDTLNITMYCTDADAFQINSLLVCMLIMLVNLYYYQCQLLFYVKILCKKRTSCNIQYAILLYLIDIFY